MKNLFISFCMATVSFNSPLCHVQKRFSPDALIADMDSMNKKIIEIHPNPFTVIDSVSYFKESSNIRNSITDSLNRDEFIQLLAPLTIKVGDGHTGLGINPAQINISQLPFPFDVWIENDRLFITKNYSSDKNIAPGSEILKVNGVLAAEIISTILKYSPGEFVDFKNRTTELLFPLVYRFNYGESDEFLVELKEGDKINSYIINQVGNRDQSIPEFMKPSDFYFVDEIAVMDLRNFWSTDFHTFIYDAFDQIADRACKSLIIDLRYNTGGQSPLADSLLSYLTDQPYQSMISDSIKISFATAEYVNQYQNMGLGEREGNMYIWNGRPVQPVERKNRFKGSIYLLTSPLTYSTAGFFANVIQCYNLGTIIGSETGQPMIAYGDSYLYSLPNTGLPCAISRQKFVFCCAEKEGQGVLPDYKIERSLKDEIEGKDRVMDFALELIRKKL